MTYLWLGNCNGKSPECYHSQKLPHCSRSLFHTWDMWQCWIRVALGVLHHFEDWNALMCLALALPSNVMHGNSNGMGDLDIHVGVAGFVFLVAISDFTARISAYGVRADINSVEFSTLCTTQFTCLQEEVPYLQVTLYQKDKQHQNFPWPECIRQYQVLQEQFHPVPVA